MKNILICLLIILALVVMFLVKFVFGYEVHRNVKYGEADCEIMDIFIPKEAYERQSNGCVLLIHGGSWSGGDKSEEEIMCRYLASRGYITATMNYSLYSDERADSYNVDMVLDEIDAALAKIKSFAADCGITVDKAATSGYSAGAHLSMLYSFSREENSPLSIEFTANLAGPADFRFEIWGRDLTVRIGEMLSGVDITEQMIENGEAEKIFEKISPVSYISADTPPSIFAYGGRDKVVSAKNGESIRARLDAIGASYDYVFFPHSSHAMIENLGKRLSYVGAVADYCEKYFD